MGRCTWELSEVMETFGILIGVLSYLGVYNCQNSSNSTTKICEISMYVNYILKKKLYIKKRQVLLLQASQKERKWGQLKEAAGAQTPARRGHR